MRPACFYLALFLVGLFLSRVPARGQVAAPDPASPPASRPATEPATELPLGTPGTRGLSGLTSDNLLNTVEGQQNTALAVPGGPAALPSGPARPQQELSPIEIGLAAVAVVGIIAALYFGLRRRA